MKTNDENTPVVHNAVIEAEPVKPIVQIEEKLENLSLDGKLGNQEPKRRKVHRKLKVPEFPKELVRTSIGEVSMIDDWAEKPEECLVNLFQQVVEAEKNACLQTYTGHFDFVNQVVQETCAEFLKRIQDETFKPRQKMRARIESQVWNNITFFVCSIFSSEKN